jgi:ABC-type antimicrobial peptide transport system permease subunit
MVLRESLGWVFLGIATGVPLALAATHLLRSFLFGVPLSDPLTYAIISAVLLGTTLVAAYLPARRGSQVAPAAVLKYE